MKLLHASDFHLDSPFRQLDEAKAVTRRRELRELPARLAKLAVEEGVDLVLLPGDLFDGERVYPETVEALAEALASIPAPVFIAPGNHDHCRPGSPYLTARWPENVHIFTRREMESVELSELNCVIHGCAFTENHREDDPLAGFAAPDDGKLHLFCVHGEVGKEGRYGPIDPRSLALSGANYVALGHVHAGTGLQFEGNTPWAYPGCPEGRGFDELGEKGCLIVTVEKGKTEAEFRPVSGRRYRIERVGANSFRESLPAEPSPDLVRIILTGESENTPDLDGLTALAQSHFFHVELRDETTLPESLWARQEEDSLTGLFLREMSRQLESADGEQRAQLLLATRFGLAALEGREDIRP